MKRTTLSLVVLAWLALAPIVSADPVRIVEGALVWTNPVAEVTLHGEGFTYSGRGDTRLGRFGPWDMCSLPECTEGSTVPLGAGLDGDVLGGTATYNGTTYRVGTGVRPEDAVIGLEWTGELQIPVGFEGGVLSAPFSFNGTFAFPTDPNNTLSVVPLFGHGTASLTFARWQVPEFSNAFEVTFARYDFSAAEPVPEPASMLLIGTGLAGLAARRVRRRTASNTTRV